MICVNCKHDNDHQYNGHECWRCRCRKIKYSEIDKVRLILGSMERLCYEDDMITKDKQLFSVLEDTNDLVYWFYTLYKGETIYCRSKLPAERFIERHAC